MKKLAFGMCLLLASAAVSARGGIILEDAPREAEPTTKSSKPGIDVPKPKDTAGRDADKAQQPTSDALRFVNKDILHGTLLAINKDTGIVWQSPDAKDSITFKPANIAEIKLDSHKPPEPASQPGHAIALTNDDELPGSIVSFDDKTLVLNTWYAGKLSIPRTMIKRITPLKSLGGAIYEGPTGLEGWTIGRQGGGKSWTYRDGAFIGTNYGMIGRDVKLPNVANIEFDIAWRGNSQASVIFYSDRTDNISNCYMLQINSGYSYLQRYSRNGGSNNLGEVQLQNFMRKDKTHVSLRTNKDSMWRGCIRVICPSGRQWVNNRAACGGSASPIRLRRACLLLPPPLPYWVRR